MKLPKPAARRAAVVARSLPSVALLTLCVAITGCNDNTPAKSATGTNASSESSPLTAPVDYLGAVGKGKQVAEKTVETASIERAIDMFKVDQGRNPKSLDELVQEGFLPKVPPPPYGMKIDYDPATGRVKVVPQQK